MDIRARLLSHCLLAVSVVLTVTTGTRLSAQTQPVVRLFASPNPAVQGVSVTLSAGVSYTGTLPTGTMTFQDGTTVLGTATLDSNATATFTTSSLPVGSNTITATYSGDSNYGSGSSQPLTETILSSAVATTTTLTSTQNPSTLGQSVTFSASITFSGTSSYNPTGTVTFMDGGTVIGTASVTTSGVGGHLNSFAYITTSALAEGSHSIQATYSGNNVFAGSPSNVVTQVVQPASPSPSATTTSLSSSTTQSTFGQSVTFSAAVTSTASGTPTGSVTFSDNGVVLGTSTLDASAQASLSTSSLSVGSHSLVASYGGDSNFAASSSASVSVTVVAPAPEATTLTLTPSSYSTTAGSTITLAVSVTSASGTPDGIVTVQQDSTILGTLNLDANGNATVTTGSLPAGNYTFSASYAGNSSFAGSSASVNVVVNPPALVGTTTALSSSAPAGSSYGQAVSFLVLVSAVNASGTPTGTVTITVGPTTATLTLDATGQAVYTTSALPVGSTTAAAVYSGDSTYAGSSSNQVQQAVTPAGTTTTVSSSANPANLGASVTITAAVAAVTTGTPSGTVTFTDNGTQLGSAVTLDANGHAQMVLSKATAGTHNIAVAYSGDTNYQPSSGEVAQVVNQAATTTTVTSSGSPSTVGASVTFTATIGGATAIAATGTVAFTDNGASLSTVTLGGNGQAALTISMLSPGTHVIVAAYGGDGNYQPSSAQVTQAVNKASTTTSVASSGSPSTAGAVVTFTVSVSAGANIAATGTVTFTDNGTLLSSLPLGANGQAALSTSTLTSGSHVIVAAYSGDSNYLPSSGQVTQVVSAVAAPSADLALRLRPSDDQVGTSRLISYDIRVTNNGPSTAQSVSVSDTLPAGVLLMRVRSQGGSCTVQGSGPGVSVSCAAAKLASGAVWQIELLVRIVSRPGSVVSNTATVSSSTADPNTANNSATASVRVVRPRDEEDDGERDFVRRPFAAPKVRTPSAPSSAKVKEHSNAHASATRNGQ